MLDTNAKTSAKILCIDDEPNILSALKRLFRSNGYKVLIAESGEEGLEILTSESVDLVISDMRMPEMNGAEFMEIVREKYPDPIRILLTGYSEIESIVSAINDGGIHRYINKPWDDNDILLIVKQALERKYLLDEKARLEALVHAQNEELKNINSNLELKIQERTAQLKIANDKLKDSFITSIKVFSSLIELRGGKLAGHSRRVADIARKIAQKMGLDAHVTQDIFVAGLLVDIGKIGFSDELLNLSINQFNADQLHEFQKHAVRAEHVLMPLEDLHATAKILRAQNERVDGAGFPDGLVANQIPLGALLLAVANDYDNLQVGTMIQRKVPSEEAREMIYRAAGSRYDAQVVNAFKALFHDQDESEEIKEIKPNQLQAGTALHSDLFSHEGTLLLPAHYVLTDTTIEKLKAFAAAHSGSMYLKIAKNGRAP